MRCEVSYFMDKYQIGRYKDANEFLALLAIRMGKLKRGGLPDKEKAARLILSDWNSGRIKYFSVPPELPKTEIESAVVTTFAAEFSLDALDKMEDEMEALESQEPLETTLVHAKMDDEASDNKKVTPAWIQIVEEKQDKKEKQEKKINADRATEFEVGAFGPQRLKKMRKLREKKEKKDRRRRDRVAKELSDGLDSAFSAM